MISVLGGLGDSLSDAHQWLARFVQEPDPHMARYDRTRRIRHKGCHFNELGPPDLLSLDLMRFGLTVFPDMWATNSEFERVRSRCSASC